MTHKPHQPNRISRLEAWAFALATTLVALIAIGILPRVHGSTTAMTTANVELAPQK